MRKAIPILIMAFALLVTTFYPVLAAEPVIWTAHFEGDRWYVASCDGFRILEAYTTDWTIYDYYDSEGNLDRQVRHVVANGKVYNSKNPENFLAYKNVTYKHIYEGGIGGGNDTIVGAYYKLTAPGYGEILLEVGRIIIDPKGDILFKAGPSDLTSGDTQALCAYLAGK